MSFVDVPSVFIGSTDDGDTFVVLNRAARGVGQVLTAAGFTARQINTRTVYLLAPTTSDEANERAGIAIYGLLSHTHDLVDLSWTTRCNPQGPEPDLRFVFTGGTVTANTEADTARSVLKQHGFEPSPDGGTYRPPAGLDEPSLLGAVVRAEARAYADGLGVRIDLGIPTPDAIPAPPGRRASHLTPGSPATRSARRRSH